MSEPEVIDAVAVVEEMPPQPPAMTLAFDPDEAVQRGMKASQSLMKVIEARNEKFLSRIKGKEYMKFEAWQMIGMFYGVTAVIETLEPYESEGGHKGFEAWAKVVNINDPAGRAIGRARAVCMFDEPSWKGWNAAERENAVASKAQTRAQAKSLRGIFAWVASLGGFEATPAEEMEVESIAGSPVPPTPVRRTSNGTPSPTEGATERSSAPASDECPTPSTTEAPTPPCETDEQGPPARQESPGNGGGGEKSRRACFAIVTAVEAKYRLNGVDSKMFWAYVTHTCGVDSRTKLTDEQRGGLLARLRLVEKDDAALNAHAAKIKETMGG